MTQRFRTLIDLTSQALTLEDEDFLKDCPYPLLLPEAVRGGWLRSSAGGGTLIHQADLADPTMQLESARAMIVRKDPDLGLGDRILLGRTVNTDITVNDHSVSKVHLELRKVPDGDWLVHDRNSSNGTRLNEKLLSPGRDYVLKSGDLVQVGRVRLVFLAAPDLLKILRED